MKSSLIAEESDRTFILILDQGEEAFQTITDFANTMQLTGASLMAIGAFRTAKVGWFDFEAKRYKPIVVDEQCEVLSMIGDIAEGYDGKSSVHTHAVLGIKDGTVRGGHFLEGIVRPTLEVTIVETRSHLRRKKKPELGIALIDPS